MMNDKETLKNALLMIQKLKQRLAEKDSAQTEEIAIVGMSCRLPQADNPKEFWDLLAQGENVIKAIPEERWRLLKGSSEINKREPSLDYPAGYLNDIAGFDAYFFGISPREAVRMDPQQRILLEVAYESLEDAGLSLKQIAGTKMGVFSSLYASPLGRMQAFDSEIDALLVPTGNAVSIAANRISYLFDLHGPSLTLDTACSSSLIATHLACLHLQTGQCEAAMVNSININLLPSLHATLSKATMLSPSGQCHTFDANADGYVQGEGAGSIILKPLSKAIKDKDRIYAVIKGSAVNQDGKTNGLTAPNGLQQEKLLRQAYRNAKVKAQDVSYIECHGTGTFLGDPIEIQALGQTLSKDRAPEKPCWIASVKTNLGHLEPAAGIISLIKTALILKHGQIPPHLNFNQPNPHIPFNHYHLAIPKQMVPLPRYTARALAGVSGFGFGGSNAHIVLEEFPENQPTNPHQSEELITLSAKDENALKALISRWISYLDQSPSPDLAAIAYNLHLKRNHFKHRLALVCASIDDLKEKLNRALSGQSGVDVWRSSESSQPQHSKQAPQDNIREMAEAYVQQVDLDWSSYERDRIYPMMDLPFYPWQHQDYWPELIQEQAPRDPYPLAGKKIPSPEKSIHFIFQLDEKNLPEMKDTFSVLHAGFYLEMLTFAAKQQFDTACFSIQALRFQSPVFVPENKCVDVHLMLNETSEGIYHFQLYTSDQKEKWSEHADGQLIPQVPERKQIDTLPFLRQRATTEGTKDSFYQRIQDMGMPAGETIRWTESYVANDKEILCDFRKPGPKDRADQFVMQIHPGVIDACIQPVFLLLPKETKQAYITEDIQSLTLYGSTEGDLHLYGVLKQFDEEDQHIEANWYLLNSKDEMVLACEGIRLCPLNNSLELESIASMKQSFYLDSSKPYSVCKSELLDYLAEELASVFSMPLDDLSLDRSLLDFGMDSLMAMAIMRMIEHQFDVNYSLQEMLKGPSIHALAENVLAEKGILKSESLQPHSVSKNNPWLAYRTPQKNVQMRLFCFPYGGGGASIYREWQAACPEGLEICPIQLPGRENRMDEKPFDELTSMMDALREALSPLLDKPFALLGHSFGSLLAFEFARHLRSHGLAMPKHLYVSAYPAVDQPSKSLIHLLDELKAIGIDLFQMDEAGIQALDDQRLTILTDVFKTHGIVDYSDERINKSIIQVLLPIFISDMKVVQSYQYEEQAPLNLPATVFLGEEDTWVKPEELSGWPAHFVQHCAFQRFNSGHLFIREPGIRQQMIHLITKALMDYFAFN